MRGFCLAEKGRLSCLIAYRVPDTISHVVVHLLDIVSFAAMLLDLRYDLLLSRAGGLPGAVCRAHI